MTRDFKTSSEAAREKAQKDELVVEQIKRAVEEAISSQGYDPFDPLGQYCQKIGIDISIRPAAGVEFGEVDISDTADKISQTPMPRVLLNYLRS